MVLLCFMFIILIMIFFFLHITNFSFGFRLLIFRKDGWLLTQDLITVLLFLNYKILSQKETWVIINGIITFYYLHLNFKLALLLVVSGATTVILYVYKIASRTALLIEGYPCNPWCLCKHKGNYENLRGVMEP